MDARNLQPTKGVPWYLLAVLLFLAGSLFFAFGGSAFLHRHFPLSRHFFPGASGTVTSTGATGIYTMQVDSCQSGERRQYFGIAFFDDAQPALGGHVAQPESGPEHLLLNNPAAGGSEQIDAAQCQTWDVDLRHTHSTYNGIWALQGHARFDCQFHDPDSHVAGDLQFRSCH